MGQIHKSTMYFAGFQSSDLDGQGSMVFHGWEGFKAQYKKKVRKRHCLNTANGTTLAAHWNPEKHPQLGYSKQGNGAVQTEGKSSSSKDGTGEGKLKDLSSVRVLDANEWGSLTPQPLLEAFKCYEPGEDGPGQEHRIAEVSR